MRATRAQVAGMGTAVTAVLTALATVTGTYGIEAGLVGLVFAVVATAMITLAWALAR